MGDIKVLLGPPGTGKTTFILNEVERLIAEGVRTPSIAFVSFTKSACREAKDRAARRFGLDPDAFPNFRTIHSMANRYRDQSLEVVAARHIKKFAGSWGYDFSDDGTSEWDLDGFTIRTIKSLADFISYVHDLSRARMCSHEEAAIHVQREGGMVPPNFRVEHADLFGKRWMQFKAEEKLVDFTDMLEAARKDPRIPGVRFAFVDEAQDNSPLQNLLIAQWFTRAPGVERTWLVGDDDQAIFTWAGAGPGQLIGAARKFGAQQLEQSHRVPASAHAFASTIIRRNASRIDKVYKPRNDAGELGIGLELDSAMSAALEADSALALVRNKMFAVEMYKLAMDSGVLFRSEVGPQSPLQKETVRRAFLGMMAIFYGGAATARQWEQIAHLVPQKDGEQEWRPRGVLAAAGRNDSPVNAERIRNEFRMGPWLEWASSRETPFDALLSLDKRERKYLGRQSFRMHNPTDESILSEMRLTITSEHRSKGREADTVVVCADMARASHQAMNVPDGREGENRVAYVSVTRAKRSLLVCAPKTDRFYDYPGLDTAAE